MKRQILVIIMCLLVYSCGFTPVYKNKNFSNFSIKSMEFNGDRNINNILKAKLFEYTNISSELTHELKINTYYIKNILAKDAGGNATNYEIKVFVNIKTNKNIALNYSEKNNIKNENNKINQKNYEKQIIKNLTSTISEKIVFDLSNLNDH